MSTKHTPGPLTVKRGQFGSSVFVLYGADDFPIAQTISNSSPEGMERARRGEHEANARRLAACWNAHDDLLAAAKLLLSSMPPHATYRNAKERSAHAALRAAIAKATGSAS